jgi:hypothetical protein
MPVPLLRGTIRRVAWSNWRLVMARVKEASRRWMYAGKRPNRVAALLNRGTGAVVAAGIGPKRLARLEVRGRRTGRRHAFPVVIAEYEGHLEEVDPSMRPPILRRYLEAAPGARAHFPVDRHAPLEQFEQIAAQYPVFRIRAD